MDDFEEDNDHGDITKWSNDKIEDTIGNLQMLQVNPGYNALIYGINRDLAVSLRDMAYEDDEVQLRLKQGFVRGMEWLMGYRIAYIKLLSSELESRSVKEDAEPRPLNEHGL